MSDIKLNIVDNCYIGCELGFLDDSIQQIC